MKSLCFISSRNLGDAVIHAGFLRKLQVLPCKYNLIIWTFPQARILFDGIPNSEVICSDFPTGLTIKSFFRGGWRSFFLAALKIRSMKVDQSLDLVGDLREYLALRIVGAKELFSPGWMMGHPMRNQNRIGPFRVKRFINIPVSVPNIYDAHKLMLRAFNSNLKFLPEIFKFPSFSEGTALLIGLHPYASASFKLWTNDNWKELILLLIKHFPGSHFVLFGAQSERAMLGELSEAIPSAHSVSTGTLGEFCENLKNIDLLIGLDSFSVHMAHSMSIPSVVLVGSNNPNMFKPPSGIVVAHSSRCPFQPCGGKPRCINMPYRYSCMTDISPQEVLSAILDPSHSAN
jgi:heptosyltransferase-3